MTDHDGPAGADRDSAGTGRNRTVRSSVIVTAVVAMLLTVAGAVPAAAAEHVGPHQVDTLVVRRHPGGFEVTVCVLAPVGPLATDATFAVRVGGRVLDDIRPTLQRELPPADPGPDACPNDSSTDVARFELTDQRLAAAGVPSPTSAVSSRLDTWVSFDLTVSMTVDGATTTATRTVDYATGLLWGAVDTSWTDSQGLHLQGSIIDPTTSEPTLFVVVVDGVVHFGPTGRPFTTSPDPGRALIDREVGGEHVIDVVVPLGRRACVQAVEPVGLTVRNNIDCVDSLDPMPIAGFETVHHDGRRATITGWLFEPTLPLPSGGATGYRSTGEITVDGQVVGSVVADVERPDLAQRFPGHNVMSGFTARFPMGPGRHRVCVEKTITDPERFGAPPPARAVAGCIPVDVPALGPVPPDGVIDSVRTDGRTIMVDGWAIDRNGGIPQVLMTVNGLPVRLLRPDRARPDVLEARGGDLTSGFSASIPAGPGGHSVCVAVQDVEQTNVWAPIGCRSVVVK